MAFFAFAEGSLAERFVSCVVNEAGREFSRCAVLSLAAGLRRSHIIVIIAIAPRWVDTLRSHAQLLRNFEGSMAAVVVRVAERRFVVFRERGLGFWHATILWKMIKAVVREIVVCILYGSQDGERIGLEGMRTGTNRWGGVAVIIKI